MVVFEPTSPAAHVYRLRVGQTVVLKSDQQGDLRMTVAELRGPVKGQVRVQWRDVSGQLRASYYYEDMLKVAGPLTAPSQSRED